MLIFPSIAGAEGQVSAAGGVVYAGSLSGDMVAIDGDTGNILWKFASGGSVICGPSIVTGTVFWGSGYSRGGTGNNKLFAFSLGQGRPGEHNGGDQ
jgi:polyvinyl alcohol dehydrogenase (cytochrome)